MDAVTSILLERGRKQKGLEKMLWASVALHVLFGVALVAGPLLRPSGGDEEIRPVMTITLPGSGATGPMTGGANPIAGRAVETTERAAKPEPVRPPAPKAPEMTMPAPSTKAPAPTRPPKTTAEAGTEPAPPSRGDKVSQGAAFGDFGAQGSGFGLSSGGVGGGGSYLDVANFCCPEYLVTIIQRIQSNWNANAGAVGDVLVKFTIQRDGTLTGVAVEQPSNVYALNAGAERAVRVTAKLPPLPAAFAGNQLTVHLKFEYKLPDAP